MNGINPIVIGEIATAILTKEIIINGAVKIILNEIIKYSAEKNIEMLKVLFRQIAIQDEKTFEKVSKLLKEKLPKNEYLELMN